MTATAGVKGKVTTGYDLSLLGAPRVGNAQAQLKDDGVTTFGQGVGAGQADLLFNDVRSIALSSNETLDLTTGLVSPLGQALVFAKVKLIDIIADPANTTDLTIGAAASNAFIGPLGGTTPTITLKPGDRLRLMSAAGWAVDSTHKALKVVNAGSAAAANYTIVIVGTSA